MMAARPFPARRRWIAGSAAAALLGSVLLAVPVTGRAGAVAAASWTAWVGPNGWNGTAMIAAPASSGKAGTLTLSLTELSPATAFPVRITKGTCASTGAVLYAGPTQKSTGAGKLAGSLPIPAAGVTSVRAAAASGQVAIRIGSGGLDLHCGLFVGGPVAAPAPAVAITVGRSTEVHHAFGSLCSDERSMWGFDESDPIAFRLDTVTGAVVSQFRFDDVLAPDTSPWGSGSSWCAALGFDSLWTLTLQHGQLPDGTFVSHRILVRLDPEAGRAVATVRFDGDAQAAAIGDGSLWVAQDKPDALLRIDPAKNAVVQTIALPFTPWDVRFEAGAAWVTSDAGFFRVDLATGVVRRIDVGPEVGVMTAGGGSIWVDAGHDRSVPPRLVRVDASTGAIVASVAIRSQSLHIGYGDGYVWMLGASATGRPAALVISAVSNKTVGEIALPESLGHLVVRGRSAWVGGGPMIRLDLAPANQSPSPTPTASPVASSTPKPSPSPSAAPSRWTWERARISTPPGNQTEPRAVVAGGPGFIAGGTGYLDDRETKYGAAVWTSTDGRRWTRLASFPSLDGTSIDSIAAAPWGLVAAGGSMRGRESADAFVSVDGRTWRHVVLATTGSAAGVAVVGRTVAIVGTAGDPRQPTSWTSTDGRHWTRSSIGGSDRTCGSARGIVVTDRRFVVYGETLDSTPSGCPSLGRAGPGERPGDGAGLVTAPWTSMDGRTWRRIKDATPFANSDVDSMASGPGGLVAIGGTANSEGGYAMASWSSPDGLAWTARGDLGARLGLGTVGGSSPHSVVFACGPDLILAMTEDFPRAGGDLQSDISFSDRWYGTRLWWSHDGATWTAEPIDQAFTAVWVYGLTEHDGTLIAVGDTSISFKNMAAVVRGVTRP